MFYAVSYTSVIINIKFFAIITKSYCQIDYPIGRQSQPLRGNCDKNEKCEANSNFYQLIKLRCDEDPSITTWLQKKSYKYTSVDIQNEILEVCFLQRMQSTARARAS